MKIIEARGVRRRGLERLEGNVVIRNFTVTGGLRASVVLFGTYPLRSRRTSACRCSALAISARTEHLHVAGENFVAGALVAGLVFPLSAADAAFNVNQLAFGKVFAADLGQFIPGHNPVPFGMLLLFAVPALEGFICGKGEVRHGSAAGGIADFGVLANAPDQDHFIHRPGHNILAYRFALRQKPASYPWFLVRMTIPNRRRRCDANSDSWALGFCSTKARSSRMPAAFSPLASRAYPFFNRAASVLSPFG